MGVRIIANDSSAVLYCSTTMWAFGPVMDTLEEAETFIKFLAPIDPRAFRDSALEERYSEFVRHYKCVCGNIADGSPYHDDQDDDGIPIHGYPATGKDQFVCELCLSKDHGGKQ